MTTNARPVPGTYAAVAGMLVTILIAVGLTTMVVHHRRDFTRRCERSGGHVLLLRGKDRPQLCLTADGRVMEP